jgi:hypothetical protein
LTLVDLSVRVFQESCSFPAGLVGPGRCRNMSNFCIDPIDRLWHLVYHAKRQTSTSLFMTSRNQITSDLSMTRKKTVYSYSAVGPELVKLLSMPVLSQHMHVPAIPRIGIICKYKKSPLLLLLLLHRTTNRHLHLSFFLFSLHLAIASGVSFSILVHFFLLGTFVRPLDVVWNIISLCC